MLKQPNTGLEERLWAVLVAALSYAGLSVDDFLVMLWCQEMRDWYLKPNVRNFWTVSGRWLKKRRRDSEWV